VRSACDRPPAYTACRRARSDRALDALPHPPRAPSMPTRPRPRATQASLDSRRHLFQNEVRVGTADTERTHAGATRTIMGFPGACRINHVERGARKVDLGIGLPEVQRGRQRLLM